MLVVHPSIPVNSVAEFVAYAKAAAARKEPISLCQRRHSELPAIWRWSISVCTPGFEAIHVPYRGNAPMVIDLVAGQVKVAFVTSAGMMDHVQAGRLKASAFRTPAVRRSRRTFRRSPSRAIPDFKVENYHVMLAPAGIPEPIAALLEREVQAALKLPDVIERLRAMDTTPVGIVGAEVRARLKADRAAWAKVVAAANMRLD